MWQDDAACAGMDTEIFYAQEGPSQAIAFETCSRCPVYDHCFQYAVDNKEEFGVWGGLAFDARDRRGRRWR